MEHSCSTVDGGWTRWAAIAYLVITKPGRALLEAIAGRPRDGWAFLRGAVSGLLAKDGTLRATHRARAS